MDGEDWGVIGELGAILGGPIGAIAGAYYGAQHDGIVGVLLGLVGGGIAGALFGPLVLLLAVAYIASKLVFGALGYMINPQKKTEIHFNQDVAQSYPLQGNGSRGRVLTVWS